MAPVAWRCTSWLGLLKSFTSLGMAWRLRAYNGKQVGWRGQDNFPGGLRLPPFPPSSQVCPTIPEGLRRPSPSGAHLLLGITVTVAFVLEVGSTQDL